MYTNFFGLTEKPFTITPDPRYLFMSARHAEALAHLLYGLTESDGFIQLTGEVGTGKTTLIRSLLQQLPENADVALVLNPQLSAPEFLTAICEELGVQFDEPARGMKIMVDALNEHLLDAHARNRRTILIVDEAQNLATEVLEQVRLLTNLETDRQKLLQIMLIGQPELRDVLARNDLRQLAQRVTARYHLEPLTAEETSLYIDHRLTIAGATAEIFSPAAKKATFKHSAGVPRVINVISDRALLGAYTREQRRITPAMVRLAVSEVSGIELKPFWSRWALPVVTGVACIVVAGGAWFTLVGSKAKQQAMSDTVVLRPTQASAAATPPTVADVSEPREAEPQLQPAADVHELLQNRQQYTGTDNALQQLFALWGAVYRNNASKACEQARQQQLSCLVQRGTWTNLQQMNRPAILTLTDDNGTEHQVVLTALQDGNAQITVGDDQLSISVQELSNYWFGEYLLLWRPPNGTVRALRPGMNDPGVLWLRQSLATILGTSINNNSPLFDAQLEQQVREYQQKRRIKVDGLVGTQTQIIINTDLRVAGTPQIAGSNPG